MRERASGGQRVRAASMIEDRDRELNAFRASTNAAISTSGRSNRSRATWTAASTAAGRPQPSWRVPHASRYGEEARKLTVFPNSRRQISPTPMGRTRPEPLSKGRRREVRKGRRTSRGTWRVARWQKVEAEPSQTFPEARPQLRQRDLAMSAVTPLGPALPRRRRESFG